MITSGLAASARAIPTRWRSPPLKACGRRAAWVGERPTVRISSLTAACRSARPAILCTLSTSARDWPTVMVGFSEEYGSWKTPWICRRTVWAVSPRWSSMLDPRYKMSPPVGLYRPRSSRPNVVLPEPVSPTRARVSPRLMASDTPSTALSTVRPRRSEPWPTLKYLVTSRVSIIGTSASATLSPTPVPADAATSASDIGPLGVHVGPQPESARAGAAVDVKDDACNVSGGLGREEE